MRDKDIVMLFQDRLETAIFETKQKYGRIISSVIYHIVGNKSDTEECESDTYLGLWNSIPPNNPRDLKAFSLKIARNQALKRYEYIHAEKRNASMSVSYDEIVDDFGDMFESIEEAITDSNISECINDFLGTLNDENRKVFMLRYWYFMSVKEIMIECDIGKSKVESILFRTRNQLKNVLIERRFFYEENHVIRDIK